MTNWVPQLEGKDGPRYHAIVDCLTEDIGQSVLKPGDRLPTHRDLAWRLGVTVGTVSRAYAEAERRGLTLGEVGRGTFVRGESLRDTQFIDIESRSASGAIDLAFAFPMPMSKADEFRDALRDLAMEPQLPELLAYQSHRGLPAHRAAGAEWIRKRGLEVSPDRVTVTSGAQHGTLAALSALTRPGDRVLVEQETYPGATAVAQMLGLRLEGVATDELGLRPDALEAACRTNDAKALYIMPTLHNPTTIIMPEARRREVAEVLKRVGLPFIEDDVFGMLMENPPPPLCTFAPDLGLFVTSLSKTVSAGLRVGFAAAPSAHGDRLVSAVRAACWMTSPLNADIAARLISSGIAERILSARRVEAMARRAVAADQLSDWDFACPPGAISLWLHLPEPWRSAEFAEEARQRGVLVKPSEPFNTSREIVTHAVRVCFGPPKERASFVEGIKRLRHVLQDGPLRAFGAIV